MTESPIQYRLHHIKVDQRFLVNINYDENTQGGWTNHNVKPPQLATESFYDALLLFRPEITMRLQLTKNGEKSVRVAEVQFEHLKKGGEFVRLVAVQDMAESEGTASSKLSRLAPQGELKKAVDLLELEAIAFIEGARGQLVLPLEQAEEEKEEDDDPGLFDDEGGEDANEG